MAFARGNPRDQRPALTWLVTQGRTPFLAVLLAITAWLGHAAGGLEIEQGGESMVSDRAGPSQGDALFRRHFGNEDEILLAVSRDDLFSPEGLRLLDDLTTRIAGMDGVRRVSSLTNALQAVHGPEGAESAPLVPRPLDAPESAVEALAALSRNPHYEGLLVSADRRSAGILIETQNRPGEFPVPGALIEGLRTLAAYRANEAAFHLAGIPVQKHDVSAYIRRDKNILLPLAALVLSGVLALATQSLAGVLIPMAATAVSLAWTMGLYALSGRPLNVVTSLVPPVVMVLSVETAVHLYFAWVRTAGQIGLQTALLVRETGALLGPCFFSALTTALGFLSLAVSDIPAVREFGFAGAAAAMIAFAVGVTLVPVCASFLPAPETGPAPPARGRDGGGALRRIARLTGSWPRTILVLALLLAAGSALMVPRVRTNTDLVRFLKADAPLRRDTEFVDSHLAGASALEFVVVRKDGRPLTSVEDVHRIATFQAAVLDLPSVAAAYSVADAIRLLHRAETGREGLPLPEEEEGIRRTLDLLDAAPDRGLAGKLVSRDFTAVRVSVRLRAVGTAEAAPLARRIVERGEAALGEQYTLAPAGSLHQVVEDSNRLVAGFLRSFALSLATVMAVIAVHFRSRRLTLIALAPNLIPILLAAGLMGIAGVELSTATAMIGSVAFGLIVDHTIHYVARFRREHRGDARRAAEAATTAAGRPLAISCLALIAGFWVGALGSFKPTIYFSLLTGVTMLAALACVLTVLPACLILADRGGRRDVP